jgi:hypothetical protein
MSKIDVIKAAAAELTPDEQYEVFKWWTESDAFRKRQLHQLKREIALGLNQLDQGHYKSYEADNAMRLAEEVKASGRKRLLKQRGKRA